MTRLHVLLVEDDEVDRLAFLRMVAQRDLPYDVCVAETVRAAGTELAAQRFDVVISDLHLGDGTGLDVLALAADAPGIIVTGSGDEASAVSGMKAGAYDYLIKDTGRAYLDRLPQTVDGAIQRDRSARQVKLLSAAVRSIQDGVCISDAADRVAFVNTAFLDLLGVTERMVLGRAAATLVGDGETERAGLVLQVDTTVVRDDDGRKLGEVRVVRDVTARVSAEAALRELSIRDDLTGLFNRREWDRLLTDELVRCHRHKGHALAVILIDLDHFKRVNDEYGHAMGDTALRAVGRVITSTLRVNDRAARHGGEELAILLPETDAKGALVVAERLRQAIEAIELPRGPRLTASFGVATYPEAGASVVAAADAALYLAKRRGRNRVERAISVTCT